MDKKYVLYYDLNDGYSYTKLEEFVRILGENGLSTILLPKTCQLHELGDWELMSIHDELHDIMESRK